MTRPVQPNTAQSAEPTDCGRCGTVPPVRPGRIPLCRRCRLLIRLEKVLPEAIANPDLQPLIEHLLADPRPSSILSWLYKPRAIELLRALSAGEIALSHDALHAWPHIQTAQHLRHRLIACGLLPDLDRHLADFEAWLHRRFGELAGHPHEQLLRRFALWHQLPRLRADAAARPLRATAVQYVIGQLTSNRQDLWMKIF